jgi:hypothetical protein
MDESGQLHATVALHQGKSTRYPLDRRVDEPQSRSGRGGEKKISQPLPETQPGRPARCKSFLILSEGSEISNLESCVKTALRSKV